jgi:tetratricopeptide (TPR) repeat protein
MEPSVKWTWLKILTFITILAFYGSLLAFKMNLPAADDLPRQIKIGELLLQGNFDILYHNIFSYTEPEHRFYNHHWFSGIIFYILHQAVGWTGLGVFKLFVFLAAFSIIFAAALRKANFWLVAILSFPTILIISERMGLRPEVFSYLFVAIYFYLLTEQDHNPESKRIYWLIPLQLFWVNMHVFFSIGIMMTAGYVFENILLHFKGWTKNPQIIKLITVFAGVLLISFLNPRGAAGVFYRYPQDFPLYIAENTPLLGYLRNESLWEDPSIPFFYVAIILVLVFLIYAWKQKQKPIFYSLAIVATIALGFRIIRSLALFGFMFLPIASAMMNGPFLALKAKLHKELPRASGWLLKGGAALVLGLYIFMVYPGWSKLYLYKQRGFGAARWAEASGEFMRNQQIPGPIFSDGDVGSYIIYNLYPKERVFADNRFGDAYSSDFFSSLLDIYLNEDTWQNALEQYSFQSIVAYHYGGTPGSRQFLSRRLFDPNWALVYYDPIVMIFVRSSPENQQLISDYGITSENLEAKLQPLVTSQYFGDQVAAADLFNIYGRPDLARETFLNVLIRWPNRARIWAVMGQMSMDVGDEANTVLAMMFIQKAIDEGRKTAEMYTLLGAIYMRMQQTDNARAVLLKALKINPFREDAATLLRQIDGVKL